MQWVGGAAPQMSMKKEKEKHVGNAAAPERIKFTVRFCSFKMTNTLHYCLNNTARVSPSLQTELRLSLETSLQP